jgi:hypothetical protein
VNHTRHHAGVPWGMARGDAAHHIVSDFVSIVCLRNADFAPARLVAQRRFRFITHSGCTSGLGEAFRMGGTNRSDKG